MGSPGALIDLVRQRYAKGFVGESEVPLGEVERRQRDQEIKAKAGRIDERETAGEKYKAGSKRLAERLQGNPITQILDEMPEDAKALLASAFEKGDVRILTSEEHAAMDEYGRRLGFQLQSRQRYASNVRSTIEKQYEPLGNADEAIRAGGAMPTVLRTLREASVGVMEFLPTEGIGMLSALHPDISLKEGREAGRRLPESFTGGPHLSASMNLPAVQRDGQWVGLGLSEREVPMEARELLGGSDLWGSTLEAGAFEEQHPLLTTGARIGGAFAPGLVSGGIGTVKSAFRGGVAAKNAALRGVIRMTAGESAAPAISAAAKAKGAVDATAAATRSPVGRFLDASAKYRDKAVFGGYGADVSETLARSLTGGRVGMTGKGLGKGFAAQGGRAFTPLELQGIRTVGRGTYFAASPLGSTMPHFINTTGILGSVEVPDTFAGRILVDVGMAIPFEAFIAIRSGMKNRRFGDAKAKGVVSEDQRAATMEEALRAHGDTMEQAEEILRAEVQIRESMNPLRSDERAAGVVGSVDWPGGRVGVSEGVQSRVVEGEQVGFRMRDPSSYYLGPPASQRALPERASVTAEEAAAVEAQRLAQEQAYGAAAGRRDVLGAPVEESTQLRPGLKPGDRRGERYPPPSRRDPSGHGAPEEGLTRVDPTAAGIPRTRGLLPEEAATSRAIREADILEEANRRQAEFVSRRSQLSTLTPAKKMAAEVDRLAKNTGLSRGEIGNLLRVSDKNLEKALIQTRKRKNLSADQSKALRREIRASRDLLGSADTGTGVMRERQIDFAEQVRKELEAGLDPDMFRGKGPEPGTPPPDLSAIRRASETPIPLRQPEASLRKPKPPETPPTSSAPTTPTKPPEPPTPAPTTPAPTPSTPTPTGKAPKGVVAYSERTIWNNQTDTEGILRTEWRVRKLKHDTETFDKFRENFGSEAIMREYMLEQRYIRNGVEEPWEMFQTAPSRTAALQYIDDGVTAVDKGLAKIQAGRAEHAAEQAAVAEKKAAEEAAAREQQRALKSSKDAFDRMAKSPKFSEWAVRWQDEINRLVAGDAGFIAKAHKDPAFREAYDAVLNATKIPSKAKAIRRFLLELPGHEARIGGAAGSRGIEKQISKLREELKGIEPGKEAHEISQRIHKEIKRLNVNLGKMKGGKGGVAPDKGPLVSRGTIKRISELTKKSERSGLSEREASEYRSLMKQYHDALFARSAPLQPSDILPQNERASVLSTKVVSEAHQNLFANKPAYDAVMDAVSGVYHRAETAIDSVMRGNNASISPQEFYNAFRSSREALRAEVGDTIALYRATGKQTQKPTQNWSTTREGAQQYGDNIVSREVALDDLVAIVVGGRKGSYHEMVVGKNPARRVTTPPKPTSASFMGEKEFVSSGPGHAKFNLGMKNLVKEGALSKDYLPLYREIFRNTNDGVLGELTLKATSQLKARTLGSSYAEEMLIQLKRDLINKPGFKKYYDAKSTVFLHEYGHIGFGNFLTSAEQARVAKVYRTLGKDKIAESYDKLGWTGGSAGYGAKNVDEFFASGFARWALLGQRNHPEFIPIFERLWKSLVDAVKRLKGKIPDDPLDDLYKKVLRADERPIHGYSTWADKRLRPELMEVSDDLVEGTFAGFGPAPKGQPPVPYVEINGRRASVAPGSIPEGTKKGAKVRVAADALDAETLKAARKKKLIDWFNVEWKSRTKAVKENRADIDWITPENRIVWSEIMAKARELGIDDHVVDLRLWWGSTKSSRKRK